MSYYFSSLVWHAASFGQLLAAAVAAYWIAKGFRLLLLPVLGGSASRLRLSSAVVGLAAFLSLVVASSYFMDRSFAAHLAQTGVAEEGRAGCTARRAGDIGPAGKVGQK
jgi:hypothetical protein